MATAEPVDPAQPAAAQTPQATSISGSQRWMRVGLTLVIALSIIGAAWFVGDRQGWSDIGGGGKNAVLLPKLGEPAPELITRSADGTPIALSQLRGQPVWINFWGSWCPPCRAEMPDIDKAYKTLAPQGLVVLSVSMQESTQDAVHYADSVGASMPIYEDPAYTAAWLQSLDESEAAAQLVGLSRNWQVANFPTHIFIDADGIVRAVVLAQMTYDEAVEYGEMVLYPDRQATTRD